MAGKPITVIAETGDVRRGRSRGVSLIEVVVFIVVLGIGISGIVTLYSQLTKASVDPLVRKQALAIASSLMEEIQLRGFTYCDPDDPNVYTAPTSTLHGHVRGGHRAG